MSISLSNELPLYLGFFLKFLAHILGYWGIPFGLQSIIIPMGPDRWGRFIDSQLAKNPSRISMSFCYAYVARFYLYSFLYPFIRKRATSKSKAFRFLCVLMWCNAFFLYSVVLFASLVPLHKHLLGE